ncbi:MAG: hypothetical protein UX67_C0053G0001 [Candidatus Woesebacteria bacterium GW2011_GWF2_46_8]|uniref:30S ribosomal protein S17 n=1 Tax=Candidatus Woesebacteria bacterium GW2011_GWF2_46_8 TaxID=1618604 RepID=A0A0G1TNQ0_9BACT|nr:MAG: hypothetical protein UX67_C0053G0001 [Candidatus Woesebacteria bacterium GW2011_GWF2_46_8]
MNEVDINLCVIFDPIKTLTYLELKEGMMVKFVASAPISKLKKWKIVEVITNKKV